MRLTKHHGLGNDFLVLLDPPPDLDAGALARKLCDRRRGIGADGLMIALAATEDADITMELRNADGGRAEMSGNGIRCFAQAVWDARLGGAQVGATADGAAGGGQADNAAVDGETAGQEVWDAGLGNQETAGQTLTVATDAGIRVVRRVSPTSAAVDMGPVKVVGDATEWATGTVEAAALVDIGNPHLVLLDPAIADVDVSIRGPEIEATFPEGINIEWIWPGPGAGEITLKVWERGAGATEACGTGSCAAAKAAHNWGKAPARVVVHNPGGDVTVELGETATLIGPVEKIATIEVLWP